MELIMSSETKTLPCELVHMDRLLIRADLKACVMLAVLLPLILYDALRSGNRFMIDRLIYNDLTLGPDLNGTILLLSLATLCVLCAGCFCLLRSLMPGSIKGSAHGKSVSATSVLSTNAYQLSAQKLRALIEERLWDHTNLTLQLRYRFALYRFKTKWCRIGMLLYFTGALLYAIAIYILHYWTSFYGFM